MQRQRTKDVRVVSVDDDEFDDDMQEAMMDKQFGDRAKSMAMGGKVGKGSNSVLDKAHKMDKVGRGTESFVAQGRERNVTGNREQALVKKATRKFNNGDVSDMSD